MHSRNDVSALTMETAPNIAQVLDDQIHGSRAKGQIEPGLNSAGYTTLLHSLSLPWMVRAMVLHNKIYITVLLQ